MYNKKTYLFLSVIIFCAFELVGSERSFFDNVIATIDTTTINVDFPIQNKEKMKNEDVSSINGIIYKFITDQEIPKNIVISEIKLIKSNQGTTIIHTENDPRLFLNQLQMQILLSFKFKKFNPQSQRPIIREIINLSLPDRINHSLIVNNPTSIVLKDKEIQEKTINRCFMIHLDNCFVYSLFNIKKNFVMDPLISFKGNCRIERI